MNVCGQDCDAAGLHLAQLRATYYKEQAEAGGKHSHIVRDIANAI